MPQIIPKNPVSVESHWQKELRQCVTDPQKLIDLLELDWADLSSDAAARKLFPLRVPMPFVARMKKGDVSDPLFRQVFTLRDEFIDVPGFSNDPLEEQDAAQKGLLHKYQSRVLLIVRGGCAVNCRYCFRRHFPYQDNSASKAEWLDAFKYIAADANINEVIFSGGDPLMAKDEHLGWMARELAKIEHVKTLRIHTRLPVVIPARIDEDFLHWFTQSRLKPVMIVHVNHPNEIDTHLTRVLLRSKEKGVTLLNQSVLLAGVNDSVDVLVALHEKLFAAGVLPYYLHLLDKVSGAGHFLVADNNAKQLMAELIKRQPGYLVPKLVREIGGQPGKTPVDLNLHP